MEATVKTPRVFVTNFAGHDYSKAEKFGTIIPLTRGNLDFGSLDRVKYYLAERIVLSTEDDYVALSGSSFIAAVVCCLWMELHGQVKILNYDKMTDEYRLFVMTARSNAGMLGDIMAGVTSPYRD